MGENTKIEWADHTLNWWTGCTKVSPACANCYAEGWAKRTGIVRWGAGAPRRLTSAANRRQPLKWNATARDTGTRPRVFFNSLSDVFDPDVPQDWRDEAFGMMRDTLHLDYLLLTKRIELAVEMLPRDWNTGYANVWLGTTVENQPYADKRIPHLLRVPARVRFLSCEPLLGEVVQPFGLIERTPEDNHAFFLHDPACPSHCDCNFACGSVIQGGIDWVIVGGESGVQARCMRPQWARSLRDQCRAAGVSFFFKQWGAWVPQNYGHGLALDGLDSSVMHKAGGKGGRLLDGREWNEIPEVKK